MVVVVVVKGRAAGDWIATLIIYAAV